MSDYAQDHLRLWIRNGMPGLSSSAFAEKCSHCGHRCRTVTGNWTVCAESGERHSKKSFEDRS